jgi:hypothetical protein
MLVGLFFLSHFAMHPPTAIAFGVPKNRKEKK